jgi:hypothetical protein
MVFKKKAGPQPEGTMASGVMKAFEAKDKAADKKRGVKEDSRKDKKIDAKAKKY